MQLYVVTILIRNRIIDVSAFDHYEKALFYAQKWSIEEGEIQIHRCLQNEFRGSEVVKTITGRSQRSLI